MRTLTRLLLAGLLGAATAALLSCGTSGKGLIPEQNAGPLQGDFQEIALAAQRGEGSCTATEAAIRKTEQDFLRLPATVDPGLHGRLAEGITHLSARARTLCAQPLSPATTTTAESTTTTETSPPATATTQTTDTSGAETAPPTSTTPTPSQPYGTEGGTPAPKGEGQPPSESGAGEGAQNGGAGITGGSGGGQ